MSEDVKEIDVDVRAAMVKRKAQVDAKGMVRRDIPGLGTIRVKRVTAGDLMKYPDGEESLRLVLAAAHDHNGMPIYLDIEPVRLEDAGIFNALLLECRRVNTVSIEDAQKK